LSPEQVTGQRADHRSDLFSLGIVLYEMLTGAPPFSGDDMTQLLYQIGTTVPPPPSAINPAVPAMLDLIIAKVLEKDADARYQSAKDLAADLRACAAELSSARGAPTAPAAADKTVKLDVELVATRTLKLEATKTVRSAAIGPATDAGTFLPLSRRFNSTEAVRELVKRAMATDTASGTAHAATPSPSAATPGALGRLLRDPGRLFFAVAVLAAAVIAVAIVVSK
jgi:serine/threonine-protein kinase